MLYYMRKIVIGFSYGASFPLTLVILDYWLKEIGVSNTYIGLFTLLHATFLCKFVWNTFIDNYDIPFLSKRVGRFRSWFITCHIMLIAGIVSMAFSSPETNIWQLILSASVVSIADGCKNIILYPYQVDKSDAMSLGHTANCVTFGHRVGMICIKVLTLELAHFYNWKVAYLVSAGLVLLLSVALFFMPIPEHTKTSRDELKNSNILTSLYASTVTPLLEMISSTNGKITIAIISTYKMADFMMQKMSRPFCIEIGFSKLEIAHIVQCFGSITVILGGFIGAILSTRYGLIKSMKAAGLAHVCTFLLYILLIHHTPSTTLLSFIIFCEAITGGCVTSLFLAFFYKTCSSATYYALLWALHEFVGMICMSLSGILVDTIGWSRFFACVPLLFVPAFYSLNKLSSIRATDWK